MTAQKQLSMTASEYRALKPKRRQKYGAKPKTVDGIRFHSTGEAMRWMELKLLERTGKIINLQRQGALPLHAPDGTMIGKLVLDFIYEDRATRNFVYEDFKGFDVPLGAWKRKHAEAEYGIKILLTGPAAKRRRA